MIINRRQALLSTLFGAGYVGLRSLATGLPASLLVNPKRALADTPMCPDASKAQFIILSTSGNGDPINASSPGTYEDPNIIHPSPALYPNIAPGQVTIAGKQYTASKIWSTLPQAVLDRTTFWHIMTNTPVHPKEPDVLRLMDATYAGEMLPSLLAQNLAPCLQTIQAQPICLGAASPTEGLQFGGQALPIVPPVALKSTLTAPAGPLANLQGLRDQSLAQIYDVYKNQANDAQRKYIDSMVTSQQQVRNINQSLLNALSMIKDNTAASQILAAITLIKMKVTPLVSIHIPFGGDNHQDVDLANEAAQTESGVGTIVSLMAQLQSAGLQDQVTFMTLNVFGRTLGVGGSGQDGYQGRNHNPALQTSLTIGKPFRGGVVGAVAFKGNSATSNDFGCTSIDSKSGNGGNGNDIAAQDTLASFGRTMLAAVGTPAATIDTQITSGKTIAGALAT